MEELALKIASEYGLSLAILVVGIWYLIREKKTLESQGIKTLEVINANLVETSKMLELVKKIDTKEYAHQLESLQEKITLLKDEIVELKNAIKP